MLLVLLDRRVQRREVVVHVDRTLLGGQLAHVAVTRQYFIVRAEVAFDRLRLGRRLDDYQMFFARHTLPRYTLSGAGLASLRV